MEIAAYDTACHRAALTQPVRVFQFLPGLQSPGNQTLAVAPVTLAWSPITGGGAAGYYVQLSLDSFSSVLASYFVPDDGRTENYSFTVPEGLDLGGSGSTVQWRVAAVASKDQPFGPLGGAVSPMREFTLGEDTLPPELYFSSPYDGETDVEPTAGISLTITDDASGVDTSSLDVQLNSISLTGLDIDDSNPNEVFVTYTPENPWIAEDNHTLKIYCQDNQGQLIDPYPTIITFTVRANRDEQNPIMVPGDFSSVQGRPGLRHLRRPYSHGRRDLYGESCADLQALGHHPFPDRVTKTPSWTVRAPRRRPLKPTAPRRLSSAT